MSKQKRDVASQDQTPRETLSPIDFGLIDRLIEKTEARGGSLMATKRRQTEEEQTTEATA